MKRIVLLCTLLVGACARSPGGEEEPSPVALVSLATASRGSIPHTIAVYGAVDAGASGQRTLTAPFEGTVISMNAPVGTRVAAGQVVARLRSSPSTQLDMAKASADARQASAAYARARRLRTDGLNSDADVESARTAAVTATATLTSLARRSGSSAVLSPAAGTVTAAEVSPGSFLATGAPIATITTLQGLRARFGVDPETARVLRPGATIHVSAALGGAPLSLSVISIDPIVDPQTRLASIYAVLPPAAAFGAGEPLRGELTVAEEGSAIVVPYSALLDDGGQAYVFVVARNVAHRRNVTVGVTDNHSATIKSGITHGDVVVVSGGTALEDGMKVRTR